MFTPEDVKNLQLIYHLVKERGFTLEFNTDTSSTTTSFIFEDYDVNFDIIE